MAAACLLLTACGKTKYDAGNVYGGVSFYNASQALDASALPNFLSGTGGARYDFPAINTGNTVP